MSTDDLDQIARLFRLRESGALTQAEFEAEKARVLSAGDEGRAVAKEVSAPEPVEAATNPNTAQAFAGSPEAGGYKRSKGPLVFAALATVLAVGAGTGWYAMRGDQNATERGTVENASPVVPTRTAPPTATPSPLNQSPPEAQPSTAPSVAPVEPSTPTVQEQPTDSQTPATSMANLPRAGEIASGSQGRISGSPARAQAPTDASSPEETTSEPDPAKAAECQRLTERLEKGEARIEELGFKAQVSRINGLSYSQTGPIIAEAIASTQRYRAMLRGKEPADCVDIGNEGIARIYSILRPLVRQN